MRVRGVGCIINSKVDIFFLILHSVGLVANNALGIQNHIFGLNLMDLMDFCNFPLDLVPLIISIL